MWQWDTWRDITNDAIPPFDPAYDESELTSEQTTKIRTFVLNYKGADSGQTRDAYALKPRENDAEGLGLLVKWVEKKWKAWKMNQRVDKKLVALEMTHYNIMGIMDSTEVG